jgi:CheY-like chemotaxis protein
MDHEEKEILKSGFDDYISKPINEELILNKMARFLIK